MRVFIIYENIEHAQIKDYSEIVGVVIGGSEDAEKFVHRLNDRYYESRCYIYRNHYWVKEADYLTEENLWMYMPEKDEAL